MENNTALAGIPVGHEPECIRAAREVREADDQCPVLVGVARLRQAVGQGVTAHDRIDMNGLIHQGLRRLPV